MLDFAYKMTIHILSKEPQPPSLWLVPQLSHVVNFRRVAFSSLIALLQPWSFIQITGNLLALQRTKAIVSRPSADTGMPTPSAALHIHLWSPPSSPAITPLGGAAPQPGQCPGAPLPASVPC